MPGCRIAIVGMACRLPDAPDVPTLWQNLLQGHRSFRDIGNERWDHEGRFFSTNPRTRNATPCRRAALLDRVEWFAGKALGISPRRATVMDPQQRLMLELAAEALQDAGLETGPFSRVQTATFVGASVSEYASLLTAKLRWKQLAGGQFGTPADAPSADDSFIQIPDVRSYTVPGGLVSMAASCVAQAFDLGGPALTVDAACASSLASVIQAVSYLQSLPQRTGAAPVALAGGVYLLLLPDNFIGFSKVGALAPDDCRPFDAGACGFLFGEGGAVVVLKRLEDAVCDGDRIYAVLRSTAWTNDGRAESPMTPRLEGQAAALRTALADAKVPSGGVGYVECHGTGTPVGDRIELLALNEALGTRSEPTALGSIKANLGHALPASGIAGLLRGVLAVYHGTIPPQAGWERWHPDLNDAAGSFRMPIQPLAWSSGPRRALVSSFGFGGTNCIAVLEGWEQDGPAAEGGLPVCCSADSPELLGDYLRSSCSSLRQGCSFPALAFTVTAARRLRAHAALFLAADGPHAVRLMEDLASGSGSPEAFLGPADGLALQEGALGEAGRRLSAGQARELFPVSSRRLACLPPVPVARERYWLTP